MQPAAALDTMNIWVYPGCMNGPDGHAEFIDPVTFYTAENLLWGYGIEEAVNSACQLMGVFWREHSSVPPTDMPRISRSVLAVVYGKTYEELAEEIITLAPAMDPNPDPSSVTRASHFWRNRATYFRQHGALAPTPR